MSIHRLFVRAKIIDGMEAERRADVKAGMLFRKVAAQGNEDTIM